jgi:hypothetical protein
VHDCARPLGLHAGKDGTVQPHSRQQVHAERQHPVLVSEREGAARLGEGRPDAVHHYVQAAEDLGRLVRYVAGPVR